MTSNCMLCVSTAKAYFPDRQSCSTLCRQPSGCARSVEVVAVYPSLGSYSIVGLLRWASLPFKKPFTLNAKKSCKIYTLSRKIFAPSPIPNGKGHFLSQIIKFFQFFYCTVYRILYSRSRAALFFSNLTKCLSDYMVFQQTLLFGL